LVIVGLLTYVVPQVVGAPAQTRREITSADGHVDYHQRFLARLVVVALAAVAIGSAALAGRAMPGATVGADDLGRSSA